MNWDQRCKCPECVCEERLYAITDATEAVCVVCRSGFHDSPTGFTERVVRETLAIVDHHTPLAIGEPLVQRVLRHFNETDEVVA